nr:hypothetical protein [uncultured archaeon]
MIPLIDAASLYLRLKLDSGSFFSDFQDKLKGIEKNKPNYQNIAKSFNDSLESILDIKIIKFIVDNRESYFQHIKKITSDLEKIFDDGGIYRYEKNLKPGDVVRTCKMIDAYGHARKNSYYHGTGVNNIPLGSVGKITYGYDDSYTVLFGRNDYDYYRPKFRSKELEVLDKKIIEKLKMFGNGKESIKIIIEQQRRNIEVGISQYDAKRLETVMWGISKMDSLGIKEKEMLGFFEQRLENIEDIKELLRKK